MRKPAFVLSAAALLCFVALGGCSVTTHENQNGNKKDVEIKSPIGDLNVREGHFDMKDTGLTAYPGARIKQDRNDEDSNVSVNIDNPLFGVKVIALKLESEDAPDKVLSFYRKEMGKYGKVVDCTGGFDLGIYGHRDKDAPVTCNGSGHDYKEALKVGTESNQRIVAVKPRGSGSLFAVVYVRTREGSNEM